MAKVNYDYPLNPDWTKPKIAGETLEDRWAVYAYYTINGNRKQYSVSSGLNDKEDTLEIRIAKAETARQNLIDNLLNRKYDDRTKSFLKTYSEAVMIQDLIEEYLLDIKPRITINTFKNYSTVFNKFKIEMENISVADLNKKLIADFLKSFKVKPQTKRSYRIYLSAFFNWIIDVRQIHMINPAVGIKLGKNDPVERHRVYTKTEIKKIVKYCDDKEDIILKTIIYLVYGAQVRISEILRIQMSDFKLDENKIVLPKGKAKVKNKRKIILLDKPLRDYLLALPIDYDNPKDLEKYFIGTKQAYARNQFVAEYPLSKNTIDTRFKLLKAELKIEQHKTLYSFKHTGNVNLLIDGADIIELMYKNGHSKISQTETYARQLIEQVPEMKYIRKTRKDFNFK
jgi:integrase